jgi:hypothetical protein
MERRIEPVVIHLRRQECTILNQEPHSFLVPFLGSNVKRCPWVQPRKEK